MTKNSGKILYSATDLVNFSECPHLTRLDRIHLDTPLPKSAPDDQSQLIAAKGFEHEEAYLQALKNRGLSVVDLKGRGKTPEESARLTLDALRAGPDIIYQAAFVSGNFMGYTDFLRRVNSPSSLGSYGYEVVDTKLARTEKAKFLIQLCFYSDLLAGAQGADPKRMHLVLGDSSEQHFRTANYSRYYRHLKERFLSHVSLDPHSGYPERCDYCKLCRWIELCEARWRADDHLNQVRAVKPAQIKKLKKHGITTMEALAGLPADFRIPNMAPAALERLSRQAGLQLDKRVSGENRHVILPPDSAGVKGFYRLPEPDEGDLFFDMEGDPLEPGGHEYLFGVYFFENGKPQFKDFWALEKHEERAVFEKFMDFVSERLRRRPAMHIYHYAAYEETALKRLMSVHGTRENEVDRLLRGKALVDLYKVVQEAVMVSEPRYSIKNLETFYMEKREGEVKTAGQSVVYFEAWRQTGDPEKLKQIRDYNEADCRSVHLLREWLLKLRPPELPWSRPPEDSTGSDETAAEAEARLNLYETRLLGGGAADGGNRVRELVFHLLEFHRREAKSTWWKLFDLSEKSHSELTEEADSLAALEFVSKEILPPPSKSLIYTYRYPPQEFKLTPGKVCLGGSPKFEEVDLLEMDEENRLVKIKCGTSRGDLPQVLSLLPGRPVPSNILKEALYRFADSVIEGDRRYAALKSFLNQELPRIQGHVPGAALLDPSKPALEQITRAVMNLEESYLFIQGPPGAGKTYTASQVIVRILKEGRKIGISSNSHKAINHLLHYVEQTAVEQGVRFKGVKKISDEDQKFQGRFFRNESNSRKIPEGGPDLIAGTAWLFCRPEFDQILDYLFVDEAGQVSLANLAVLGMSAKNLVLLGDQMQLAQPIQGIHPGKSSLSALDYLLGEQPAIPPEQGVFLETSFRMHEDVCRFISDAVYDGKLHPQTRNQTRRLVLTPDAHPALKPTGIAFLEVSHADCRRTSREEAATVRNLYDSLLQQSYLDPDGTKHPVTPKEILVVSPYNMQVNLLRKTLPAGAKVGTIDKFQGQEAEVVIISLATSSGEDLPREIEFLYSKNRMNVAISRARCLALVVANPNLLSIKCRTAEQMELVNGLCWVSEYSQINPVKTKI